MKAAKTERETTREQAARPRRVARQGDWTGEGDKTGEGD